ncbi:MAG TPA: DUF2520 domain-containing protein [Thermoanaerobaculia bacterium]|nr:DUF2520 domain-containing protein [Thermoanaerobaculia bacterium]
MSEPLAGVRFSLVGPGKVGTSLAAWAVASGARLMSTAGRVSLEEMESAGQDLLLVAVSDSALPAVAATLAGRPQAAVALHTSGALDASVLSPLRQAGSAVGSLHPLKAFPRPLPDPAQARGVFFGVDGDPAARAMAGRLAEAWGAVAGEVPAEARLLYHFAATLAAGGVVTLLAAAEDLAGRLGLPPQVTAGYLELSRGAMAAALETGAAGDSLPGAITGPVARGDVGLVLRQLDALRRTDPGKLPLVLQLARETLRQVSRRAPLDPGQEELREEIERLLRDPLSPH